MTILHWLFRLFRNFFQYSLFPIFTLIIIPFSHFQTGQLQADECDPPSWWQSSSLTTNKQYYYGMGNGDDKKEAKTEAISDLTSQLSVSINSEVKQKTGYERIKDVDYRDDEIESTIKAVTKLTIKGIRQHKYEQICSTVYVAMRIKVTDAKKQILNQDKVMAEIKRKIDFRLMTLEKNQKTLLSIIKDIDSKNQLANELAAQKGYKKLIKIIFDRALTAYDRQNYKLARSLFYKIGIIGNHKAQFYLGVMHLKGLGIKTNLRESAKWFLMAARGGDALSQYNLGIMYAKKGKKKDLTLAAKWLKKAAKQDHTESQFNLGSLYDEGRGIPLNDELAVKWYQKAAENDHVEAQYNLAIMYANGEGTKKDPKTAVKWFQNAAAKGHTAAQYNLGLFYQKGIGLNEDESKAVYWLKKAANNGSSEAKKVLKEMED